MHEIVKSLFSSYSLSQAEYKFLAADAMARNLRTILEFGPGVSTFAFLNAGASKILSLEYNQEWVHKYIKVFETQPNVNVHHYKNTAYLNIKEANDQKFDAAFIDSPTGGMYRKFSRINSALYASARTEILYIHDAERPAEQRTVAVLQELGWSQVASGPHNKIAVLKKKKLEYTVLPRHARK